MTTWNGAAVCDAELQLPEVREVKEREGGEGGVGNKRDRSNPVFFSPGRKWMGRNLSHSSISHWKLSLQFITNPPGVILFSTDGTSQRDPPLFSIRRDLPVIRNANRVQSFWQLRPSSPPLPSTRRELSLSNRRREREKITDELYSSLWNISLQDINSSIIRTSDIPSRVNHEYDKSIWNKGVHVCIRVGDFFLPFFFSLMNLICRDFSADSVTNRINSKERNFLSFSYFFVARNFYRPYWNRLLSDIITILSP